MATTRHTNPYMNTGADKPPATTEEHYDQAMRLIDVAHGHADATNLLAAANAHMTAGVLLALTDAFDVELPRGVVAREAQDAGPLAGPTGLRVVRNAH